MADFPSIIDLSSLGADGDGVGGGGAAGDYAGWSVACAGDVNGDGIDDILIGAPGDGSGAGKAYLVFGKAGGIGPVDLGALTAAQGFVISGEALGDVAGWSVASAGDLNHDGLADIIVGARLADGGGLEDSGRAYVIFGRSDFAGSVDLAALDPGRGFTIDPGTAFDHAGWSVAPAGDVDGDGIDDLLIGVPGTDDGGTDRGAAYVIFGHSGGFGAVALDSLGGQGFAIMGGADYDEAGRSVASAGDVNGDGFDDIIVGAGHANGYAGAAYVVFGHGGGFATVDLGALAAADGFALLGADGEQAGFSVSSAGDINGDGFDDLIVGAPYADSGAGRAYVVFGHGGTCETLNFSYLTASQGFVISGAGESDKAGWSVAGGGDINGDGFGDLIVGAPYADNGGGMDRGAAYVIFGHNGTFGPINLGAIVAGQVFAIYGADDYDQAGRSVAFSGDFNMDGVDDLIVGAPYSGAGDSGGAYIIYGKSNLMAGPVELFDGSGNLVNTFLTIQAAIDAALAGYKVVIGDGTYTEQLHVNGKTNLTITADNPGAVTVLAPDVMAVNGHSTHYDVDVRAVIAVNDSTGVTISGITVDGSFAGDTTPGSNGDELSGIGYFRSSGSVDDVDIVHVGNSQGGGLFGLQHGSGLFIDGEPTSGLAVSVTDSTISDFQKTGALIFGVDLNFTGNTITGIGGTGLTAQNGIQIGNAEGVIDGNTITGFGYSGGGYYSSGVIAYEPSGALAITDNIITGAGDDGSAAGIDLSDVRGIAVEISGNSFTSLDYGVYAYTYTGGPIGLDTAPNFSGNTFFDIRLEGMHVAPEESYGAPFTTSNAFNLTGTDQDDVLAGSLGNDTLTGLGGDDTLTGNGGNDNLSGGDNADTAVYGGPRGDYTIGVTTDAGGRVTGFTSVTDTNGATNGDDGSDTLTGIEKLQFNGQALDLGQPVQLFDDAGNLVGTFGTIQAAIDASSDDYTIRAAAGTYNESLTVNHGVTILGAEADVAVGGRDAAGGVGETTIIGHATVTAADNVTLNGLRFLNDATTSAGGPAIYFTTGGGATGHLVTDSIFWSTVAGGAGSADDRAIFAQVIPDGLITVTDNLISGTSHGQFSTASWGRGIWFDGGGVDLVVTGNTIEWTRTGLNLDMSGDSTANVSNNDFRNLGTGLALGVDADGLTVSGNDVTNVGDDFSFRNLTTDVTFDAGTAIDTLTPVGNGNDYVVILGGSGSDTLTGTAGADYIDANNNPVNPNASDNDVLNGAGGNDILFGRGGNDTLDGGTGDDAMTGGAGDDTYVVDSSGDTVTETSGQGTDEVRTTLASYTLATDLENLTGLGNVNQSLTGNGGNNVITGAGGNDAIDGGAGTDTARYAGPATIAPNIGGWTVTAGSEGTDTLTNVEIVDDSAPGVILLVGNGGFATIQAAVNAAHDGDTIMVASGTYVEQVVVNNIDNLTIMAATGATVTIQAPADVVQTGTSSSGRAVNAVLTVIGSTNVSIDHIDINGAGHGDTVDGSNANFIGVFYRNASGSLLGVDVTGIHDPYPGGTAAGGEPLQSGNQRGVGVQADNDAGFLAFTMTGGSISDFQKNATVFNHTDLNVTGVTITGGGAQTINAQNGIQALNSTGTISGNTITGIGYAGAADAYSGGILLFGNTDLFVTGNTIVGSNEDSADAKVVGIYVFQSGPANSGGEISGNDISFVDEGIDVTGDITPNGILIQNNDVTDIDTNDPFAAGIYFAPNPALTTAYDIDGTEGDDFISGGAGNDTLSALDGNDTLTDNGGDDTLHGDGDTDTAVYAGPRSGYAVTTVMGPNGLVTGFSAVDDTDTGNGDEGTDTLTGIERLKFGDAVLSLADPVQLFDDNGDLVGTFATIQAAVNAAHDSYSIVVGAGTYVEQVIVNNIDNLTISAASGAQVTIQAPADLVETARSSSDREIHAVFTVKDSANVVLDHIDIDGAGAGNTVDEGGGAGQANFYGVFYRNSSGGLTDVDVAHIRDQLISGELSGVQRGVGVVTDNASILAFFMHGGSITDFQKNATVFNGSNLDVSGVTITGGGATDNIAQNGIQVTNSTGNISGNTITGIGYAGPGDVYSGAVLAFGNTGLNIINNIITGANIDSTDAHVVGIFVLDFGTPNSGGSITGNTISYVDEGIDVSGDITPNGILIENNDVTNIDTNDTYAAGIYFAPNPALATAYDIDGTAGDDFISGGAGNDTLSALGGNDTLTGNGGDDNLSGGGDSDTAVYAGPRADYTIVYTTDANGVVTGFSSVTDNVTAGLNEGTDTLTSIERLHFNDVTLDLGQRVQLFDGGGILVGTFDDIQDAIDAASDGYRIEAQAGTYAESLTVDKDITIEGANQGIPGTGGRGAETVITGNVTISAAGVTINGVEITGAAADALGTTGVVVQGGANGFSLVNSVLNGSGDLGMIVGLVTGLDVGHNLIEGYASGMYVAGGGTTGSVHDNRFQGLDNGLQSETTHVTISGNTFDGISGGSLFLYPSGPDSVDLDSYITGNTISNSGADRPVQILPTNLTHNVIGTDYNEAFDGETAAANGVTGAFSFDGRGGDDHAWGGGEGDTFTGGTGDEFLYGNAGNDTAVYAGNRADYTITYDASGFLTVLDNEAGDGDEG
ncbi:MAG TPA: hypothetical protein VK614_06845, partial [Allosphingosinicella sp.]|nr:hypothetical protein [Allosphingosinicella sp.]